MCAQSSLKVMSLKCHSGMRAVCLRPCNLGLATTTSAPSFGRLLKSLSSPSLGGSTFETTKEAVNYPKEVHPVQRAIVFAPTSWPRSNLYFVGYYVTFVDPESKDFTMNVVKIDHDHAPCTRPKLPSFNVSAETVTFKLASSMQAPSTLAVWFSNFQDYSDSPELMVRKPDITVGSDGTFSLNVPVGSFFTVSTIKNGPTKGIPSPPKSVPQFPLPYSDDFTGWVPQTTVP